MNYYLFHLKDYASKTRHLTWDEDMAYRRLLDLYYTTEKPLPLNKAAIYRFAMAQTPEQRAAIDTVLGEFFDETPDGYRNDRCDEEVKRCNEKSAKASHSASKRWSNANAMPTHSDANAPNTQYPIPNTQERESAREVPKILQEREVTEEAYKDVARNLIQSGNCTDWERQFLGSIATSRSLSRHQRERFDAIVAAQDLRPAAEMDKKAKAREVLKRSGLLK